jgi:outer membrane protein assembly factor BamB
MNMPRLIIFLLLISSFQLIAQNTSCWSDFRGNQSLTGTTKASIPNNPKLLWTFQAGDNIKSAPVVCDDKIVVGATNGTVFCLDLKGKLIWKYKTENSIEAPALILNSKVYIGNLDGTLFALNLSDGKLVWKYKTDNQISGSVNWWKSGNQTLLVVGSYDYFLHCVDAQTGKEKWKYESSNYINGSAACFNGKAIFGGCDGFLHVVDLNKGTLDTKIDVATYVAGSCPVEDQMAYIGDYDGKFSKVDIRNKKIVWSWENPNKDAKQPFVASAALEGNRVISGSRDKCVYCFDKMTGKVLWSYNTGKMVEASPLIVNDKVLVANMRGDLTMLNLSNGAKSWTYEIGSAIPGNPAVINNMIII